MTIYPRGATVLLDKKYRVKVWECYPEGSHSSSWPHYVVTETGRFEDRMTVLASRIGTES
jgi:hypothetical protein